MFEAHRQEFDMQEKTALHSGKKIEMQEKTALHTSTLTPKLDCIITKLIVNNFISVHRVLNLSQTSRHKGLKYAMQNTQ